MEYNSGSNRASNFKSAERVTRGRFEIRARITPELYGRRSVARVRYIKIQLETTDMTTRLWGYDIRICMVYFIKPRSDVCCFKLNFNVSNVGYY